MVSSSTTSFLLLFLFLGCAYASILDSDDGDYKDLSFGISSFSNKFLNNLSKSNKEKSVILSPISVIYVLYMTYLGARGLTGYELLNRIGVSKLKVHDQFTAMSSALADLEDVTFTMANKIYVNTDEGFILDDDYTSKVTETTGGEVESIDFSESKAAAEKINKWVEEQTNDKIASLIQPNDLNSSTRLALISGIYFKGKWNRTFNKKQTTSRDFHVTKKKTVKLPMMSMTAKLPYIEVPELGSKIIKLDFVGEKTSLMIMLPDDIEGIEKMNDKISKNPKLIYEALAKFKVTEVDVRIPKFKTETTIDLKEHLPELGVKRIFDPKKSRLQNMLEDPQHLYVSKMMQKAVIDVNEEGVEAAAATGAVVGMTSVRRPAKKISTFYADHPFNYVIATNDLILLFGGIFDGE